MARSYDVIVIGAGSVGVPAALFLAIEGLRVLVLEKRSSVGQGENKAAIGGVRATHSEPAKILICRESLRIFREWRETYGQEIGWKQGGYCFPAFRSQEENILKRLLPVQQSWGLDAGWVDADDLPEIVPGICTDGLLGGVYSPGDGQASPLLSIGAMFAVSRAYGCEYRFNEQVDGIEIKNGRVEGVQTNRDVYRTPVVLVAAGSDAADVGRCAGIEIPVVPESHEAGVSAPVAQFLGPLVVDLRPDPDGKTANFYFTQDRDGAVLFCYTPKTPFRHAGSEPTSEFLPVSARRMMDVLPRLKNMLVRRVWRGYYPSTPDGLPVCGAVREAEGLYLAVGMCGQGFMMGPGLGKNMATLIVKGHPEIDTGIFNTMSLYRDFYCSRKEALR